MEVNKFAVLASFIWKLLERGGTQVILFIVTIILARLLTPDDYGTVAIVMVLISLATVFVEGGLNTALIQKKNSDQTDYSTIFYFSIVVAVVVYIIMFVSAPYIATFYSKPELDLIIKVLGICLFFNAVNSVQRAYLYQNLLFRKLFVSSLTGAIISAIVGIAMAHLGYGIWSLVVQQLVLATLTTLVMWKTVRWRPTWTFSLDRFQSLFNYGWKIFVSNLSISLFINIRSLIIGRVFSASSLAYFDRGKQFPSLIMDNINAAIQSVMFPVLSKEQDEIDVVKSMVKRSTLVSAYILYPILVILCLMAKPLTILLLTDKWLDIVPFIQVFCIANLFMPIQNVNMEAIKSLGYSGITLKLELIKKVLEIAILIATVYVGVYAIAWGVVIYNAICVFINLSPCEHLYDYSISEQIKDNMPSFYLSVLLVVLLYGLKFIPFSPFLEIVIGSIIGILFYLSLSKIFRVNPYVYLENMFFKLIKNSI